MARKQMNKNNENHKKQEVTLQLIGWILFVVCAFFFIASSLKNQDVLAFIGSVVFLLSCVAFIIPLVRKMKNQEE